MKNRSLLLSTAVWVVSTLLLLVFFPDLASILWILMLGVQLGFLVCALILLIWAVRSLRRSPRVAAICVLLVVGTLAFAFTAGRAWGERTRFALVRHSYEQRLQEILRSCEKGPPSAPRNADYKIEPGPPVRVAFVWQAGVTDNWVGLVYDPTDLVMRANEFKADWSNWKDPALAPVKRLFGGDLLRARRLQDHWYLCVFT